MISYDSISFVVAIITLIFMPKGCLTFYYGGKYIRYFQNNAMLIS